MSIGLFYILPWYKVLNCHGLSNLSLDTLYIHPLPYLSDPTDPMTCLRPQLLSIPTAFGITTPGLRNAVLSDEKKFLSRWREYFEILLNPVKATLTDACDVIDFRNKEVFTLTVVAATIRELKSRRLMVKMKSDLECRRHWMEKKYIG